MAPHSKESFPKEALAAVLQKAPRSVLVDGKFLTIPHTESKPNFDANGVLVDTDYITTQHRVKMKVDSNKKITMIDVHDPKNKMEVEFKNKDDMFTQIVDIMNNTYTKYKKLVSSITSRQYICVFDRGSGIVVIQSPEYQQMLWHAKTANARMEPEFLTLIRDFMCEYIIDYISVFRPLSHSLTYKGRTLMPIRARLVNGLFQPLVVRTDYIETPLYFSGFSNIRNLLANSIDSNPEWVRVPITIELVSSYDFASVLKIPVPRELSPFYFTLGLYMLLLTASDKVNVRDDANSFFETYKEVIRRGLSENQNDEASVARYLQYMLNSRVADKFIESGGIT